MQPYQHEQNIKYTQRPLILAYTEMLAKDIFGQIEMNETRQLEVVSVTPLSTITPQSSREASSITDLTD